MKFCLFTAGSGKKAIAKEAAFIFFAHRVEDLHDEFRPFGLSVEDIGRLNPNTFTCPIFRSARDAELTKSLYRRVPIFRVESAENPCKIERWDAKLFTMLHSAGAAHLFLDTAALSGQATPHGNRWKRDDSWYLPLYEGKMFHQFDHRFAGVIMTQNLARPAQPFDATTEQKQDPEWSPSPRAWVAAEEISSHCPLGMRTTWFLGYKDVGSATNERTLIATILPEVAIVDSVNLVGLPSHTAVDAACLLSAFNSFALDYTVRQKTGGLHIKFYLLNQLPVLPPATYAQPCPWGNDPKSENSNPQSLRDWLLPRVLELTYTAWDLEAFAADCGWSGPPFRWDEERRFLLRCELDAAFFHLYLGPQSEWQQQPEALTRAFPTPRHAVSYIMDTFPIVKRKDEAKHGHYRTKETILQIYDALTEAMQSGVPYKTLLNPSPADPACCHPPRSSLLQ
jgi:hypothetical protein